MASEPSSAAVITDWMISGGTLGSSAEIPSIGLSATKTRPTNSTMYGSTIRISSAATMPAILATL